MSKRVWIVAIVGILGLYGSLASAGSVGLIWNASDRADGYNAYYGTVSGQYSSQVNVGPETQITLMDLMDGQTYYFAVTAYNIYGESGFSNEVSKFLAPADTIPPIVMITNPSDGGTVQRKGLVTITADASDDSGSVAYVTFTINGTVQCSIGTAPYRCTWHVPAPPNRLYQLQAHAFDAANNVGHSAIVEVTAR